MYKNGDLYLSNFIFYMKDMIENSINKEDEYIGRVVISDCVSIQNGEVVIDTEKEINISQLTDLSLTFILKKDENTKNGKPFIRPTLYEDLEVPYYLGECLSDSACTSLLTFSLEMKELPLVPASTHPNVVSEASPFYPPFKDGTNVFQSKSEYIDKGKASSEIRTLNQILQNLDSSVNYVKLAAEINKISSYLQDTDILSLYIKKQAIDLSTELAPKQDTYLLVGRHNINYHVSGTGTITDVHWYYIAPGLGTLAEKTISTSNQYKMATSGHIQYGAVFANPFYESLITYPYYFSATFVPKYICNIYYNKGAFSRLSYTDNYMIHYSPYGATRLKEINSSVIQYTEVWGGKTFVKEDFEEETAEKVLGVGSDGNIQYTHTLLDQSNGQFLLKDSNGKWLGDLKYGINISTNMCIREEPYEEETRFWTQSNTWNHVKAHRIIVGVTTHFFGMDGTYARKTQIRRTIPIGDGTGDIEARWADTYEEGLTSSEPNNEELLPGWTTYFFHEQQYYNFKQKIKDNELLITNDNRTGLFKDRDFSLYPSNGIDK